MAKTKRSSEQFGGFIHGTALLLFPKSELLCFANNASVDTQSVMMMTTTATNASAYTQTGTVLIRPSFAVFFFFIIFSNRTNVLSQKTNNGNDFAWFLLRLVIDMTAIGSENRIKRSTKDVIRRWCGRRTDRRNAPDHQQHSH